MRKDKYHVLYIVAIAILFSLITINNNIGSNSNSNNVSALSYSSSVGIGFTFNPTLSIDISSDLIINNLIPGSSSDSNIINVSVATNTAYGYTLSAIINGNNSDLTHTDNSINNSNNNNNVFSSIATDSSLPSLVTDNTWGYSYKLSNDTNWNNYSGLSTETSKTLVDSNDQTAIPIDFKIGAKAASTQPSGTYTGVINFTAVTKHIPVTLAEAYASEGKTMTNGFYTMQDMTSTICSKVEAIGSQLQVLDKRDNKLYWIAKLADNKCWMTQNLDLDLSHEVALTSETSDIDPESYGKTIYTTETGYSRDETTGIVSWLPSNIDSDDVQRVDTMGMVWNDENATTPYWNYSRDKPLSADPGVKYRYTNPFSFNENTYSSLETCSSENSDDVIGCQHAYFGNYYNWPAAVASNNTYDASGNQINSICSKNWSLPVNNNYKTMLTIQKIYNGSNGYTSNGFNNFRTSPLYFTPFGYISPNSLIGIGRNGRYWSKTAYSDDGISYSLSFNNSGGLWPTSHSGYDARFYGFSVRCIAE